VLDAAAKLDMAMRTLNVFINRSLIGHLSEGDGLWRFAYDAAWTASPQSFDLSPALPRQAGVIEDGGSLRPVQWYFDNLLPEEGLRRATLLEAKIVGDDAFALLQYLGSESAGSLTLLPEDAPRMSPSAGGARALSKAALSARIRALPRQTLGHDSPKRMSLAGAQHKLLVVYKNGLLFEPTGNAPSTHILKPNHPDVAYASSVMNEYFTMRLAGMMGLNVPSVHRLYVPEPVYVIERFDRSPSAAGITDRLHTLDACQLLNQSGQFKYHAATLETLARLVNLCRNRVQTRLLLYRWLVFNTLIANHDCHLKNLSFRVSTEGITLAPHYDLLCTGVYDTRVYADDRAIWPTTKLAIALPNASSFEQVTRSALIEAGAALGLSASIAKRELNRQISKLPTALAKLTAQIDRENQNAPNAARVYLAGEMRLIQAITHIVVPQLLGQLAT
jgi:serine/threonine-protein kinase HipA